MIRFVLLIFLPIFAGSLWAQDARNLRSSYSSASAEKRVALVIGNAAYKQGPLRNPVNDARAMAGRLRSLGFDVILKENLKTRDIVGVYREFRSKIAAGSTALVFYAGHGIQFKGQNYFPAVDSTIGEEEDVPLQSLNLGTLLDNMEEAKAGVSLVLLDACRDNPFARHFRSASRGLVKVEAASGTLIHYATKPGSVAADGEGNNGIYTEALLAQMSEPGVPVEMMLKKVANRVVDKTKGKQEPWIEGSLRGDFYFILQRPASVTVQSVQTDPETEAWAVAERVNSASAYRAYLDGYPNGRFAVAARIALDGLENGKETPQSVETGSASAVPVTFGFVNAKRITDRIGSNAADLEKINRHIKLVAERHDIGIVFQKAVWASSAIDVTEYVLKSVAGVNSDTNELIIRLRSRSKVGFVNAKGITDRIGSNAADLEKINRHIKLVAEQRNIAIVFQEAVWASSAIDMTEYVLESLRRQ